MGTVAARTTDRLDQRGRSTAHGDADLQRPQPLGDRAGPQPERSPASLDELSYVNDTETPRLVAMSAAPAGTWPEVTDADAIDDKAWYADHPDRRFRIRASDGGMWVIHQRPQGNDPDVYQRTLSRTIVPAYRDRDGEIAPLWYQAAYPDWPPEQCRKWVRQALKRQLPK